MLSSLGIKRAKALAGIVMALSSEQEASSPTSLSLSPFWHYHYSILNKVVSEICNESDFERRLHRLFSWYFPESSTYILQSDITPLVKAHSPTLEDRCYISIPNNIIGRNQPISAGFKCAYVNVSADKAWSLPLSTRRVPFEEDDRVFSARQLNEVLSSLDYPLNDGKTVVNVADSAYAVPEYLQPTLSKHSHLVQVVRYRAGSKVYKKYVGTSKKKVYGDIYYLQEANEKKCFNPRTKEYFIKSQQSIFNQDADEHHCFDLITQRGRKCIVELWRFNDWLMRGKQQYPMQEHPYDLVACQVRDAVTGALVFKNTSYMGVWGARRREISTKAVYQHYLLRYDIEPHFRFSKQSLMLDRYQTSETAHLEAWLKIVALSYWLLFVASEEVELNINPWEHYLPKVKKVKDPEGKKQLRKTPAMTRRGVRKLLLTFELALFKPQKSKGGKGRKKGASQIKRKHHAIRKKQKKVPRNKGTPPI